MGTRSVLLLSTVYLATVPLAMAAEPSTGDLIKLAPVIASSDRAYQSIAIAGSMKQNGVHLRFQAIYQAPDFHAMLFTDRGDGTPLVFIADRQMLIYDPVQPAVIRVKNAVSNLTLRGDGDKPQFKYGLGVSSEASGREKKPGELTLDFRSICELPAVEEKVVKDGDGKYRLFRTNANGSTTVFSIDPSRKSPFTGLKVYLKDSHEAFLSIDRIEVNVQLKDEEFRFPDKARLAEKITVKDWPGDGVGQALGGVAMMMRAYEARLGANHPGMRKSVRFASLKGIRWDQVRENDRKFSSLMKGILPAEPLGP